jgi:hypothetical protein
MITNLLKYSLVSACILICMCSCFKEDTPMKALPVNSKEFQIKYSIYNYQTFFDLSEDTSYTNANSTWDLAFESGTDGWHIRPNYSNYIGILNTGSTDFNATTYSTKDKTWLYDASSGNPDSTAIGDWQHPASGSPEVYLVGIYDGAKYTSVRKIRFTQVTDTSYSFAYAGIDNSAKKEIVLKKIPAYNYTYFSFTKGDTVNVEPLKDKWDLLFTQYMTTLFTNEGIATPYLVRGVYINPNKVAAMVDSVTGYDNINISNIVESKMSTIQDIIGYNWKSVEINQSSNSASYAIRKNYTYIIRDTEGDYYKFRFLSFVNESLLVGYPSFEKEKL